VFEFFIYLVKYGESFGIWSLMKSAEECDSLRCLSLASVCTTAVYIERYLFVSSLVPISLYEERLLLKRLKQSIAAGLMTPCSKLSRFYRKLCVRQVSRQLLYRCTCESFAGVCYTDYWNALCSCCNYVYYQFFIDNDDNSIHCFQFACHRNSANVEFQFLISIHSCIVGQRTVLPRLCR